MLEVKKATYISDYKIEFLFNNKEKKIIDLKKSLDGFIYEPLKDLNYFKKFHINFNTIEWENGADFAPEYLISLK